MGLSTEAIVLAGLIVFVAGLAQGLTGFGFAMVAAPVLLLMLQPRSVVALNLFLATFIGVVLAVQSLRHISLSMVALLFFASVPGSLIGIYILQVAEASLLKVLISTTVVVVAIPLYLGRTFSFSHERLASAASGLISGVLSTTTSLSGPPVVLFLVNQGWAKEMLRATVSTYLLASSFVGVGLLAGVGAYGGELLLLGAGLVPAALCGYALGTKLVPKVHGDGFRKITVILVALAGLSGVSTELWGAFVARLFS